MRAWKIVAAISLGVAAAAATARAQDHDGAVVMFRLREQLTQRPNGVFAGGGFRLVLKGRGLTTDGIAELRLAVGDADLTVPLRRGGFSGKLETESGSVRASVLARSGRVHARFRGTTIDGAGAPFAGSAFDKCSAEDHFGTALYDLAEGTLVLGEREIPLAVGVAGRGDVTRNHGKTPRVTLLSVGRSVGTADPAPVVTFVPALPGEPWKGRARGQVLSVTAPLDALALAVDGGASRDVPAFDPEALDFGDSGRIADGVVSRAVGGRTVVQTRFDALVPALPGPHAVVVAARTASGRTDSAEQLFTAPANDPPLVISVYEHAVEVRGDGLVWAWGDNSNGAVGNGTSQSDPVSPVPLAGPENVKDAAAGGLFSVAVDGAGQVWLWGRYNDNTRPYGSVPAPLTGMPDIVSVAAGTLHGLALDTDGGVWSFGDNGSGQLGIGTLANHWRDPQRVTGLPPVTAVAAGDHTSLALAADGRVFTWGEQEVGPGGSEQFRPFRVRGIPPAIAISARRFQNSDVAMALTADGAVWQWGSGTYNEGGPEPFQVQGLPAIRAISCGGAFHDLALARDGTVWALGQNVVGLFGNGTYEDGVAPAQVPGLERIVRIAAGADTASFAIDADGATYLFGDFESVFTDRPYGSTTVPILAPRPFVPGNRPHHGYAK